MISLLTYFHYSSNCTSCLTGHVWFCFLDPLHCIQSLQFSTFSQFWLRNGRQCWFFSCFYFSLITVGEFLHPNCGFFKYSAVFKLWILDFFGQFPYKIENKYQWKLMYKRGILDNSPFPRYRAKLMDFHASLRSPNYDLNHKSTLSSTVYVVN